MLRTSHQRKELVTADPANQELLKTVTIQPRYKRKTGSDIRFIFFPVFFDLPDGLLF